MSKEIISKALKESNFNLACLNYNCVIRDYFNIGLLIWRRAQNPKPWLEEARAFSLEAFSTLSNSGLNESFSNLIDMEDSLYAAYLIGLPHPPLNLEELDHTLASAFFGNVLIGAADIVDWPKHRDGIPDEKRYDLARRTNELYADLLAGRVTAEKGVPLAEALWAEREEDDYFQVGGEGGGDENHQIVDYRLGAILKKIGSTVPTVHAWVW